MRKSLAFFLRRCSGATSIEYGLIGTLIALAILFAMRSTGPKISAALRDVQSNIAMAFPDLGTGQLATASPAAGPNWKATIARGSGVDKTPTATISNSAGPDQKRAVSAARSGAR